MSIRIAAFASAFFFLALMLSGQEYPSLADGIKTITSVADSFPPRIETPEERARIEDLWRYLEEGLVGYLESGSDSTGSAEYLLGDLYRMGHNLDIEGSKEKAINYLNRAAELMPGGVRPHFQLGRLLTYSAEYEAGEVELLRAYALAPPESKLRISFDLANNAYFQKKFALAALYADRILQVNPNDKVMTAIKDFSQKALSGEIQPKTVPIETDGPPEGELHVIRNE